MTIHIEGFEFDAIIGLLDFERDKPQRVIVDLEASYDYTDGNFINYADITSLLQAEIQQKQYKLLEEALLGTQILLCKHYVHIKTLKIKISKPDILPNCRVALSSSWKF